MAGPNYISRQIIGQNWSAEREISEQVLLRPPNEGNSHCSFSVYANLTWISVTYNQKHTTFPYTCSKAPISPHLFHMLVLSCSLLRMLPDQGIICAF